MHTTVKQRRKQNLNI